jgi:hypothetical protein
MPKEQYIVLDFNDVKQLSLEDLDDIVTECNNINVKTIYFTLKNIIIPTLREMGKYAEIVPLPLSDGGIY